MDRKGPSTSLEDFRALVRRAELPMNEAQILEFYNGPWAHVERMVALVRGEGVPRFSEPAPVFHAERQQ
jgi:hypothetical protein